MQVVDSEGYLKVKLVGGPVGPFVPYTGATANVNLGEYEIKAGQFTLDTSPTGTAVVGTTRWNDSIGSSETTLKGGSVILKNGVDLVARVVNKVTPNATLTKANYTAVRISGAQGQRLAVAYAQANNDANSADTIGLVTETIPTNQEGFIITVGNLEGVNTTGALQGETWADGDVLYLSPTTPGAITNIKPNGSTGHIIVIGYVEYAHAINGKIYVKIMNGWELDELHNVYINPATLANNNILQYDSADQLWKNKVLSTGITIGSTAIASGTVGRVLFQGTGNVVQQSSSLFWDATNNRLGIGTSTPARTLDVQSAQSVVRVLSTTNTNYSALVFNNFAGDFWVGRESSSGNSLGMTAPAYAGVINARGDYPLYIGRNDFNNITISTNNNVLIGTTTDAGFRLDVNGTARVQDNLTIVKNQNSATIISMTNNSNSASSVVGVNLTSSNGTASFAKYSATTNAYKFLAANDVYISNGVGDIAFLTDSATGRIKFGAGASSTAQMTLFSTGNFGINTTTDAGFRLDVNGTARVQGATTFNNSLTNTSGGFSHSSASPSNDAFFTLLSSNIRFYVSANGYCKTTTSIVADTNGVGSVNASAISQIDSTTKGFLPPRMTTTQKNAIASPAAGLVVYDTTLNKLCVYTTAWETVTSL